MNTFDLSYGLTHLKDDSDKLTREAVASFFLVGGGSFIFNQQLHLGLANFPKHTFTFQIMLFDFLTGSVNTRKKRFRYYVE